jgi:glycosyltransferase involved in cell wall biosynthesis
VAAVTPATEPPWWWEDIRLDRGLCPLDHVRLRFRGKKGKQITTLELPFFLLKLLRELFTMRRKYDYVFTVECDFVGLGIAFWQSLLFMKKPRHVILQFIMREKTTSLPSRVKYALMTFMFRSVHRVICSSRDETEYYRTVFGWAPGKARFVPILTSPRFLAVGEPVPTENFLLAAGRVFRDYATAIAAVRGTPFRLVIVGAQGVTRSVQGDEQVEVLEEIPLEQFNDLTRRCAAVIVPLVDTKISTGQTVVIQAMAMGKLVIATRTAGTVDYVDHMVNGVLVAPGDVEGMRAAMLSAADQRLRITLGQRAREAVAKRCLPHHYTEAVRAVL